MPIKYNEVIKQPNIEQEWTKEQIEELIKCSSNPFEFFKHIKIVHGDYGRIHFKPFDFQTELVQKFQNSNEIISLCGRQLGKCNFFNTLIKIRNKHTGIIEEIKIGDFFNRVKNSK